LAGHRAHLARAGLPFFWRFAEPGIIRRDAALGGMVKAELETSCSSATVASPELGSGGQALELLATRRRRS